MQCSADHADLGLSGDAEFIKLWIRLHLIFMNHGDRVRCSNAQQVINTCASPQRQHTNSTGVIAAASHWALAVTPVELLQALARMHADIHSLLCFEPSRMHRSIIPFDQAMTH